MYAMDDSLRGGHRHKNTTQALICLQGRCVIDCHDGSQTSEYNLDQPNKCLILKPEDWHQINRLSDNAILMVLASQLYNPEDYIYEPYR